jgi:hypothetical protein
MRLGIQPSEERDMSPVRPGADESVVCEKARRRMTTARSTLPVLRLRCVACPTSSIRQHEWRPVVAVSYQPCVCEAFAQRVNHRNTSQ